MKYLSSILLLILILAGLFSLFSLPDYFSQNFYVDENALMPNGANPTIPLDFGDGVVKLERHLADIRFKSRCEFDFSFSKSDF